ncbi:apolipoprotein A1/A4/E family protein [Microbacterium sp. TPD7012]|uniref:apolipoprotein A1/A4/E family protein n=1 Tax=Microbacterium sp. TPD7012 TaxID=2171975 RepID=UPI001FAE8078|nr:apolipoprotein A1/A4/E family protein [Microbacterium sp. TPD7012]
MYVSVETLTIVISAIGIVLTLGASLFAGFAWMVRRIDAVDTKLTTRINAVDEKLTARIDAVEEKLTARIDAVEEKLTARIDALADEVTGVKIAIARLEGPPRHLVTASS